MKTYNLPTALRLTTLALGALALVIQPEGTMAQEAQTPKTFEYAKTTKARVQYLLHLPAGYNSDQSKRWPLILFLHGAGERGSNIWKVAIHGPPSLVTNNFELPFIVVSPQCPEGKTWSRDILIGLLDDVMATYRADPERVYLTGLSMGGYGTWDLGVSYPERFAAIAPICGGGERLTVLLASREKAVALRSLGVWAFHGAKDPVVPLSESERMIQAVRNFGVKDAKLTVYPEADHNSWTQTYTNRELYAWFLEHRRAK